MYSIEQYSTHILKNLLFKGLAAIALAGITFSVTNTTVSATSLIGDDSDSSLPLLGSEGISDDAHSAVSFTLLAGNNYNVNDASLSQNNDLSQTNPIVEIVNNTPTGITSFGESITVSNGFTFTKPTPSFDIDIKHVPEPRLLNEPNALPGLFVLTGFALLLCKKKKETESM